MSTDERYPAVLLFGAPGAGKGTQGKVLGNIPGFFHQSSGDVFRTIDVHSKEGEQFFAYSSRGELVPDDLTIQIWRKNLNALRVLSLYKPKTDLLILDGIPRTVNQAKIMEQYVNVLKVIYLVCEDEETMVERLRRRALKENRVDDARVEVIRRRWEVFKEETRPILEFYSGEIVVKVDGVRGPAFVLQDILRILAPIQDEHFGNALDDGSSLGR